MFKNVYNKKKVFITGHTGFKGSWLCHWLLQLGADVAGYSLDLPTQPSNFEILNLKSQMKDLRGDIRDYEKLLKAMKDFKPEIVFHLAAQSLVRKSYDEPKYTFDVNLGGTVNVLEAVRNISGVKSMVIITSDKCYENLEKDHAYRENDRLGGKDPYSASKAGAEIASHAYFHSFISSSGTRMATSRAGNVIGGGDWAQDRIVPDFIRAWLEKKELKIRHPSATRPWQHVLEPLSGYLTLGSHLYESSDLSGESYNFGPSTDICPTVQELITLLQRKLESSHSVVFEPENQKKEAMLLKLSHEKATKELLWKPTLTFDQTVDMTANWYKAFSEKKNMTEVTTQQIRYYQDLAIQKKIPWSA